jgi:hypothetical protein
MSVLKLQKVVSYFVSQTSLLGLIGLQDFISLLCGMTNQQESSGLEGQSFEIFLHL